MLGSKYVYFWVIIVFLLNVKSIEEQYLKKKILSRDYDVTVFITKQYLIIILTIFDEVIYLFIKMKRQSILKCDF